MNRILFSVVIVFVLIVGGCSSGSDTEATDSTTTTLSTPTTTEAPATTVVPETTSTSVATTTTAAVTTSTTLAPFDPTEPSVMVNGGWLAYECRGEGTPTVVVDHGLTDDTTTARDPNWGLWSGTADIIAETNKVCVYGRRGVYGSEPVPASPVRTTQDQVDDLNGLIDALELETPVILVGHSLGGYNIRLLAGQYPEKVAGLVFVDGTDPGIDEFDSPPPPFPSEWLDLVVSSAQVAAVSDLGDLPMHVLTATKVNPNNTTDTERPDWWFELQDNLLALSTNSIQTMVEATHETIYWAKPETVVEAVAWVTAQVD